MPPPLDGITEECFRRYCIWEGDRRDLQRTVVDPFAETAKDSSPYNEFNQVPEGENGETELRCGSVTFVISAKNTTSRPPYEDIVNGFRRHVLGLEESWREETLRKGFRTFEGELYVSAGDLLSRLSGHVQMAKEERAGVGKEITLLSPPELAGETPEFMPIDYSRYYAASSEYNARAFQHARNMIAEGNARTVGRGRGEERIHMFEELLFDDSLQVLGEAPETTVQLDYPFEHLTFTHVIRPSKSVSYADVVALLIKPFPEGVEEGSKPLRKKMTTGDLVLAASLWKEGFHEALRERAILTVDFEKEYDPRAEGNEVYVKASAVLKRLDRYIKEKTATKYNQDIVVAIPRELH